MSFENDRENAKFEIIKPYLVLFVLDLASEKGLCQNAQY